MIISDKEFLTQIEMSESSIWELMLMELIYEWME